MSVTPEGVAQRQKIASLQRLSELVSAREWDLAALEGRHAEEHARLDAGLDLVRQFVIDGWVAGANFTELSHISQLPEDTMMTWIGDAYVNDEA